MENDKEAIERARKNAQILVEYTRWLNIGPAQGWNENKMRYLLCLGSYDNVKFDSKLLGKIFNVPPATVSAQLSQLVNEGCISLEQDSEDGRYKKISLTEEGKEQYKSCALFLLGNSEGNPIDSNQVGVGYL